MTFSQRKPIKLNSRLVDLIMENHFILLMLEHFEIDFVVNNKTIENICLENNINPEIFIAIANLYNNNDPSHIINYTSNDIAFIIKVLKNTHLYYKQDKYPEIQHYIQNLNQNNTSAGIILLEKFFNEYFNEVIEHLDYEDNVAFPYFSKLLNGNQLKEYRIKKKGNFSVTTYQNHHTDIESKLADLKNLLLKHLILKYDLSLRRKLLFSLFELEFDLKVHSLIEENILIPMVKEIERGEHE